MHSAYFGEVKKELQNTKEVSWYMLVPMIVLAILCIILGIAPGVLLLPINSMLNEFGINNVTLSLTTVELKDVVLNTLEIAVIIIALVAFINWIISYKTKSREVNVFLCGVHDLDEYEKHLKSTDMYEDVKKAIKFTVSVVKRTFGLKGSYNER